MPLTAEARMEGLERANRVRAKRSRLKHDLRMGHVYLADILLSEEDRLRSMRVRDLLLATPGIGKVKANRALQACWLNPTISLHHTSRKSREKLLRWIERTHPNVNVGEWKSTNDSEGLERHA